MKILYQSPSIHSIYAGRTIHNGYRNAFLELGHEFRFLTADDKFSEVMQSYRPDIFITASHFYYQRYLDNALLNECRKEGLFVFVWIDSWESGINATRINEAPSLKNNKRVLEMITRNTLGDAYLSGIEQSDERMVGFEKEMGVTYSTVPLAADHTVIYPEFSDNYVADISYIGTYLPQKRHFFKEWVFPLKEKYDLRLYGQDWTYISRISGWLQKGGQLFNVPGLRSLQKPKLDLADERKIYNSSIISINIHEDFQRRCGGDCNERTFKVPLAGGFEVSDDVSCIRKYFKADKELVIAENKSDWYEKIDYYIRHPEKRVSIIEAGRRRVLENHTYVCRVKQMMDVYLSTRNQI